MKNFFLLLLVIFLIATVVVVPSTQAKVTVSGIDSDNTTIIG